MRAPDCIIQSAVPHSNNLAALLNVGYHLASDGQTVLLKLGDELHQTMAIKSNCSVSVRNVRYSTDGPLPDIVSISLNDTGIGSFNTVSREGEGQLWNVFRDSGPMGQHLQLKSGMQL